MRIRFFNTSVADFVDRLEKSTYAKVLRAVDLLAAFGKDLRMPHSKSIGNNLFELRIRGKQEIRILYSFSGGEVILVHGFVKKSKKISSNDLRLALNRLKTLDR